MSELSPTRVRVKSMSWLADGVVSLVLEALDGRDLPAASAGAHIDLNLNGKLSRSYSIVRCEGTPRRYEIAVARDAASRGGSRHIHDTLRVGEVLQIGAPRNLFPLVEEASLSVLIAGGIGITPLFAMVQRLEALGRAWALHYAARERGCAAYLSEIERLSDVSTEGKLHVYFDGEPGGQRLDIATVLRETPGDAHVYCCGPQSMLDAFEAAAVGRRAENVHLERFAHRGARAIGTVLRGAGRPVDSRRAARKQHRRAVWLHAGDLRGLRNACARRDARSSGPSVVRRSPGHRAEHADLLLAQRYASFDAGRVDVATLAATSGSRIS